MAIDIKKLTDAVAATQGAEASTLLVLEAMKAQIAALSSANTDPALQAQIDELADTLTAGADGLAKAVATEPPATTEPAPATDAPTA